MTVSWVEALGQFSFLCFCTGRAALSCVHQIQMSTNVSWAGGVGRRAGAEPLRSAAPD
jgi:hypothetical protein